jgi:hypothetical protein
MSSTLLVAGEMIEFAEYPIQLLQRRFRQGGLQNRSDILVQMDGITCSEQDDVNPRLVAAETIRRFGNRRHAGFVDQKSEWIVSIEVISSKLSFGDEVRA